MREIKYRAWDKKLKSMAKVISLSFYEDDSPYKGNETESFLYFEKLDTTSLRPFNEIELMQYTGLKDKHLTEEIAIGDVLLISSPKGKFKAKVIKEIGAFGVVAIERQIKDYFEDNWNDDFMTLLDIYWNSNDDDNVLSQVEIIGNIYENPELIEVAKNDN